CVIRLSFFSFTASARAEFSTLSLHDALPICPLRRRRSVGRSSCSRSSGGAQANQTGASIDRNRRPANEKSRSRAHRRLRRNGCEDRKSTRLNSSHLGISYAVFCLKKKKHYLA